MIYFINIMLVLMLTMLWYLNIMAMVLSAPGWVVGVVWLVTLMEIVAVAYHFVAGWKERTDAD